MNGSEGLIWILVGCWIPTRFTNTVLQRRLVLDVELVDSPLMYNEHISFVLSFTHTFQVLDIQTWQTDYYSYGQVRDVRLARTASLAHRPLNQPSTVQLPTLRLNPASIIPHKSHTIRSRTDRYRYALQEILILTTNIWGSASWMQG